MDNSAARKSCILFTAALLLIILIMPGCWDCVEVEELAYVIGVLVDDAPGGKVSLEVQTLNARALGGGGGGVTGGGGGGRAVKPYNNYVSAADTLFDADRDMVKGMSRRLFFSQNQIIVVTEKAAREEGLRKNLDFFVRNPEFRRTNWVFVFKGGEPKKLFELPGIIEPTPVQRILGRIKNKRKTNEFAPVQLGEFIMNLESEGIQPFAGGIKVKPSKAFVKTDIEKILGVGTAKENVVLEGTAVFKNERLAGWLNETETRGLLWVVNKVEGGSLTVPFESLNDQVTLEIIRARSQVEPEIRDGRIFMSVKVNAVTNIGESEVTRDFSNPAAVEELRRRAAKVIANEIRLALEKTQGELRSDIFGFGRALHRKFPRQWKQVKEKWDEKVFPRVQVELEVNIIIRSVGLVGKGVQPKD